MITCPECASTAYHGTLFCGGCGAPLHPAAEAHLAARQAEGSRPEPVKPSLGVKSARPGGLVHDKSTTVRGSSRGTTRRFSIEQLASGGAAALVDMTIGGQTLRLPLAADGLIHIGREDPAEGFAPEVDLDPHDGFDQGVSRRHATVRSCSQGVVVVDEGSSNGTWLDGRRLAPGFAYLLPRSAELKFGELVVQVALED